MANNAREYERTDETPRSVQNNDGPTQNRYSRILLKYYAKLFINLPVRDLKRSIAFYEALGFVKNPTFSDENGSSLTWSSDIVVMLLTHDFYRKFIRNKRIIDARMESGALIALALPSKEAVQASDDSMCPFVKRGDIDATEVMPP